MTTSQTPALTGYYCLEAETVRDAPDCTACIAMENFSPLFAHWLASGEAWEVMEAKVARSVPWARCTGAQDCPEEWHIHGCFADNGQCDTPLDCAATLVSAAVRDAWKLRAPGPGIQAHDVKYHHGGEVVCTCGAYFRTERFALGANEARTGLALWAEHVRKPG